MHREDRNDQRAQQARGERSYEMDLDFKARVYPSV